MLEASWKLKNGFDGGFVLSLVHINTSFELDGSKKTKLCLRNLDLDLPQTHLFCAEGLSVSSKIIAPCIRQCIFNLPTVRGIQLTLRPCEVVHYKPLFVFVIVVNGRSASSVPSSSETPEQSTARKMSSSAKTSINTIIIHLTSLPLRRRTVHPKLETDHLLLPLPLTATTTT